MLRSGIECHYGLVYAHALLLVNYQNFDNLPLAKFLSEA
jgi:hypothetical protein